MCNGNHPQIEAIEYARKYFAKFVDKYEKEIQILMGTLMYLRVGIHNSPYRYLIAPEMWIEVSLILSFNAINIFMFEHTYFI